jgi:hypothetical protein
VADLSQALLPSVSMNMKLKLRLIAIKRDGQFSMLKKWAPI